MTYQNDIFNRMFQLLFLFLPIQVIKVYSEDETSRALEVPSDITARDVCQLLILKNHYIDDHSWTLFEHLPHIGLGKDKELQSHPCFSVPYSFDCMAKIFFRCTKIEEIYEQSFSLLFLFLVLVVERQRTQHKMEIRTEILHMYHPSLFK